MTARDWRAQKREATRRRLTAAAFALFTERGYDAVPVADIAAAAEVSVPTFYAYFRTKEHVVLPEQDLAAIGAVLARQPVELPLPERIRRGLHEMIDSLPEERRENLLRRWQLAATVPAVRSRSADRQHASAGVIGEALGLDVSNSDGAAGVVVVEACLTAATAAFLRWAALAGTRPLGDVLDEAFIALRSI